MNKATSSLGLPGQSVNACCPRITFNSNDNFSFFTFQKNPCYSFKRILVWTRKYKVILYIIRLFIVCLPLIVGVKSLTVTILIPSFTLDPQTIRGVLEIAMCLVLCPPECVSSPGNTSSLNSLCLVNICFFFRIPVQVLFLLGSFLWRPHYSFHVVFSEGLSLG